MTFYSDLPVYKITYDLLLAIFRFAKNFGKEYKYNVGKSLKKVTIDLLTLIYRANIKLNKQEVLQEARERIEVIRLFIRLIEHLLHKRPTNKVCSPQNSRIHSELKLRQPEMFYMQTLF
jgi:hypothetical protein